MSAMERDALVLRLSTAIIDEGCKPSEEEAGRAAAIVMKLGPQLQRETEQIHLECMRAVKTAVEEAEHIFKASNLGARLKHPIDSQARMLEIVNAEVEKCSEKIRKAADRTFKQFRKEFGFEFGYNDTRTRLRENSGLEYYRHLLAYGSRWGAAFGLIGRALSLIEPVGVGRGLQLANQAISIVAGAVLSQANAGLISSARSLYHIFDTADPPKGLYDAQLFKIERTRAHAVQALAVKAAAAYADPDNPAHQACAARFGAMQARGYDAGRLLALATDLHALCGLDLHLNGDKSIGIDDAVPPAARIAWLLHKHLDALPNLHSLCASAGTMTGPERAVVIESLTRAICTGTQREDLDVHALAQEIARVGLQAQQASGMDDDTYRRAVTPGEPMLRTCGTEFGTVIQKMMETTLRKEKELFGSRSLLSAQFKGLRRNAIGTAIVMVVFAAGGVVAIGAAASVSGPAGAAGVGAGFTLGAAWATKATRNNAAALWFREDCHGQTDYQLFNLLHPQHYSPFAGQAGQDRIRQNIMEAFAKTHMPLYDKFMGRIRLSMNALQEDQCIKASQAQARMGADLLAAIESFQTDGRGTSVARMVGLEFETERKAGNAKKHKAVLDEAGAMAASVRTLAELGKSQIQPEEPQEFDDIADEHAASQMKSWAVRRSKKYVAKQARFVPGASGKTAAHAQIEDLRARVRSRFDGYLAYGAGDPSFKVSQAEWDGVQTVIVLSHEDSETAQWLAATEARMRRDGILAADSMEAFHLDRLQVAGAEQLHKHWNARAQKLEERIRMGQIIMDDMLNLETGRFDAIQDPTGTIGKHLRSPIEGYEDYKYNSINNLGAVAAYRGYYRAMSAIFPASVLGFLSFGLQVGSMVVQIADTAGLLPKLRIMQDVPAFEKFDSQGNKLATSGITANATALGSTVQANAMNLLQPFGNPGTFAAGNRKDLLFGAYMAGHPAFTAYLDKVTANSLSYALWKKQWTDARIDVEQTVSAMTHTIGTNKQKSHAHARAHRPGLKMTRIEASAWAKAVSQSKNSCFTRIAELLDPESVFRNIRYGKYARLHYDKTGLDRRGLAMYFAFIAALASANSTPHAASAADIAQIDKMAAAVLRSPAAHGELSAALAELGMPGAQDGDPAELAARLREGALHDPWLRLLLSTAFLRTLPPPEDPPGTAGHAAARAFAAAAIEQVEADACHVIEAKLRQCLQSAQSPLALHDLQDLQRAASRARAQLGQLRMVRPDLADRYQPLLDRVVEAVRPLQTRL